MTAGLFIYRGPLRILSASISRSVYFDALRTNYMSGDQPKFVLVAYGRSVFNLI